VRALALQGRAAARHTINGLACAIGLVMLLAVLSRLHPQWFPANDQLEFLDSQTARKLSYPLNYWNALAGFMAIGAVLLLGVAATARTRLGQALAAAAVPLVGLGDYLCVSRGGAIVLVAGVAAYFLLAGDRLSKVPTLLAAGGGTAILVAAATQRHAVQTGIDTAAGRQQGSEMIWLCLIVCAGVGLIQVAVGLLARHAERPRALQVSRGGTVAVAGVLAVVALAAFFGAGLDGRVSHAWHDFKQPPAAGDVRGGDVFARLQGTAGQGRYQYWQAAVHEYQTDRVHGTGAGTFELWWARHATVGGPVLDAHSLYAQTLGEVGIVGFLLLIALVGLTLGGGAVRTIFVDVHGEIATEALSEVSTVLNERLSGLTLREIRSSLGARLRDSTHHPASHELLNIFVEEGEQLFEAALPLDEENVVLGQASVLAEHPEFASGESLRKLMELTETRHQLGELLRRRSTQPGLSITIGNEHHDPRLDNFTIVTAEYHAGPLSGVIGVLGPTRMPYDKVISLVSYTSLLVSDLLE
jgi:hypothetical protein